MALPRVTGRSTCLPGLSTHGTARRVYLCECILQTLISKLIKINEAPKNEMQDRALCTRQRGEAL